MSKPEDIPQEVWDKVGEWADWYCADPFRSLEETVARAILKEREECALVAQDDDGVFTHYGMDKNTAFAQQVARDIAAAIRARKGA